LLDALIEIAIDCPATIIRVTGHTDDSGNVASNEILGRARAMRMIAYMASRGVPIDQFEAPVSVSDQANTDDPTVRSRQLSRRAEIEMIIP
jgi:OOP family OmpA-OmpF porin